MTENRAYPKTYRVSAIVSLYQAERFLRGRLSNLIEQSLYERGELQIVIVNSGSPEDEGRIVQDFQDRFEHIRYLETSKRESLYKAWNRCIEFSDGQYVTNANADDRLRCDAYEKLAITLDENPSSGFAYGDAILSDKENENFDEVIDRSVYSSQDYFGPDLMLHQFLGHQAMWRRSLHDRVGPFDPSFIAAGDYDFFLRGALVCRGTRVPDCLGTLLRRSDSLTFSDGTMNGEVASIRDEFRTKDNILKLFSMEGVEIESEGMEEACLVEMGNRALSYYPQWGAGRPDADLDFAKICYGWALDGRAKGPKSEEAKRYAARNGDVVEILRGETDSGGQVSIACPNLHIPSTSSGIRRALWPFDSLESSVSKSSTWRNRTGQLERYWMTLLNLKEKEIESLAAYSAKDGGFAIWGASPRGIFLARVLLLKGIPVRFFLDNDKTKIGTELLGKPVCGIEELWSSKSRDVKILLACSEQQNRFILAQLREKSLESRLWR